MTAPTFRPADPQEATEASRECSRRAALALFRGEPLATVVATMLASGIDRETAISAAASAKIARDPVFDAGRWAMRRLAAMEVVCAAQDELTHLVPNDEGMVRRRRDLSGKRFLRRYYAANTPVLLEGLCAGWPAVHRWTPEHLVGLLGEEVVEIDCGTPFDSISEIARGSRGFRTDVPFHLYVKAVCSARKVGRLAATADLLLRPAAAQILNDFALDSRYLRPVSRETGDGGAEAILQLDAAETQVGLHQEDVNLLMHQVFGWRHFVLLPAPQTYLLDDIVGSQCAVNLLAPDSARPPALPPCRPVQVTVGPGDALFVPVGWWYQVFTLETSISVATTGFRFSNTPMSTRRRD